MGIATQDLYKQIETGQIQSVDFIPGFAKNVRAYIRETGMLEASMKTSRVAMQRFGTAFKLNILESFDAGVESGLSDFFNNLTSIAKNAAPVFRTLGRVVGKILSTISVVLRSLYQLWRPLSIIIDKVFARLGEVLDSDYEKLGLLGKGFRNLMSIASNMAGVLIAPFALLELAMDRMEKSDPGEFDLATGAGVAFNPLHLGQGPIGLVKGLVKSYANSSRGTSTNSDVKVDINVNGVTDPEVVGGIVEQKVWSILDFTFSSNMAPGG